MYAMTYPEDENAVMTWALKQLPAMADGEFSKWQRLLESRIGLDLSEQRRPFLESKLRMRMRAVNCESYTEYYELIRSSKTGLIEWFSLIDNLTIQETRFYRDPASFELVSDYMHSRVLSGSQTSGIQAWSVGCASGEESYSLAMLLQECFLALGVKQYFGISGTDISLSAIDQARKGSFSGRKLNNVSLELKQKYFARTAEDQYLFSPELRKRVCFSRVNLLELGKVPLRNMDIIFCQNVLIYFKRWRRREILNHFVDCLAPGGLLVLGQGEAADWEHPGIDRVPNEKALAFIRRSGSNH
jgi:chemotaxis protein methyltransferase CheR/type IV pilus assembly protein PilK